MSAVPKPVSSLKTLGNVHHAAYRCRDAEQTRWFYEEVLGPHSEEAAAVREELAELRVRNDGE